MLKCLKEYRLFGATSLGPGPILPS